MSPEQQLSPPLFPNRFAAGHPVPAIHDGDVVAPLAAPDQVADPVASRISAAMIQPSNSGCRFDPVASAATASPTPLALSTRLNPPPSPFSDPATRAPVNALPLTMVVELTGLADCSVVTWLSSQLFTR